MISFTIWLQLVPILSYQLAETKPTEKPTGCRRRTLVTDSISALASETWQTGRWRTGKKLVFFGKNWENLQKLETLGNKNGKKWEQITNNWKQLGKKWGKNIEKIGDLCPKSTEFDAGNLLWKLSAIAFFANCQQRKHWYSLRLHSCVYHSDGAKITFWILLFSVICIVSNRERFNLDKP